MKGYLVSVGTMYVQGFKADPISKELLYVKLNPILGYARLIINKEAAQNVAAAINGSVICLEENEREEI